MKNCRRLFLRKNPFFLRAHHALADAQRFQYAVIVTHQADKVHAVGQVDERIFFTGYVLKARYLATDDVVQNNFVHQIIIDDGEGVGGRIWEYPQLVGLNFRHRTVDVQRTLRGNTVREKEGKNEK